ncbi:MAG: PQQ-binding-like beta-propeller repeat protein [Candidatus Aminicenantales bacterium]
MINPFEVMRKIALSLIVLGLGLGAQFCSSVRPNVSSPYAAGSLFPLGEAAEVIYEGEINRLSRRENEWIYFSTRNGAIYCVNGEKKEIAWKFTAENPVALPPFVGQEHLFFQDTQNNITGLDKKGNMLWEKKIHGNISSEVRENQGRIFLGTDNGEFLVLETAQGDDVWRYQAKGKVLTEAVCWRDEIIFGADDRQLYFLGRNGQLHAAHSLPAGIQGPLYLEGNSLYFSTDDRFFYRLDLNRRKVKWKTATGGTLVSSPVTDKKRMFILNSNNVLACLNKKSGDILWWKGIPSRSSYDLELCGEKIVVSSSSSLLVFFDAVTGEKAGEYDAGQEIRSNPLWFESYLVIHLFNSEENKGRLVFLKKKEDQQSPSESERRGNNEKR